MQAVEEDDSVVAEISKGVLGAPTLEQGGRRC